jgi:hypothetical protein
MTSRVCTHMEYIAPSEIINSSSSRWLVLSLHQKGFEGQVHHGAGVQRRLLIGFGSDCCSMCTAVWETPMVHVVL